ncbi:unnamed protein product, partial [Prorocentrum cordatum]
GYRRIVNVDTSAVVIKQMADRNRELRPELQWLVADVTRMTEFADESFDAVLDKSVLDTMACGENAPAVIDAYLRQVLRVLRPDGVMLCVSYSAPASRREYFRQPHLQFTLKEVLIPPRDTAASKHYAYVLRKASESTTPECALRSGSAGTWALISARGQATCSGLCCEYLGVASHLHVVFSLTVASHLHVVFSLAASRAFYNPCEPP